MFNVVVNRFDMGRVPFPNRINGFVYIGLYKVVKRSYCSTAIMIAQFGIWVAGIVQNLIFMTYGRAWSFVKIGIYIIFYSTVGTFGKFKIDLQFKIAIKISGHYIATRGRFFTS